MMHLRRGAIHCARLGRHFSLVGAMNCAPTHHLQGWRPYMLSIPGICTNFVLTNHQYFRYSRESYLKGWLIGCVDQLPTSQGPRKRWGERQKNVHGAAMFGYRGLPVSKSRQGPLLRTLWYSAARNIAAGAL